jgi:hypothetical protein
MLNGETFQHFCRNPISDSEAQNFREFLYRWNCSSFNGSTSCKLKICKNLYR